MMLLPGLHIHLTMGAHFQRWCSLRSSLLSWWSWHTSHLGQSLNWGTQVMTVVLAQGWCHAHTPAHLDFYLLWCWHIFLVFVVVRSFILSVLYFFLGGVIPSGAIDYSWLNAHWLLLIWFEEPSRPACQACAQLFDLSSWSLWCFLHTPAVMLVAIAYGPWDWRWVARIMLSTGGTQEIWTCDHMVVGRCSKFLLCSSEAKIPDWLCDCSSPWPSGHYHCSDACVISV